MNRTGYILAIGLVALTGLVGVQIANRVGSDTSVAAPSTNGSAGTDSAATDTPAETAPPALADAPPNLGPAKQLTGLDGWLQTEDPALGEDVTITEVAGDVTVVQFWTFSCINCKRTLENMSNLYEAHRDEGLEVLGVHAPEFSFEEDPAAVAEAAVDLDVVWPIGLDTNKKNFRAWQGSRRFWPRTYVVDKNGDLRFDHIGEGKYDELNATVAWLLDNGGA